MGVGIAYPLSDFDTINVDICRLSDERPGGWPREKVDEDESASGGKVVGKAIQKFNDTLKALAARTIQTIVNSYVVKRLGYTGEKDIDPWQMSENRFNVLLTVVLRGRAEGSSAFSISNYHMPCAFFAPPVMNIHSEMVARRVQDLAKQSCESLGNCANSGEMIPYILAGDFNIMPDSSHYKLLTSGELEKSDPTYPPPKHGVEWKVESLPMDSAYAVCDSEPEFSNFAHIRDQPDPFIGTLDYIFLSKQEQTCSDAGGWWKVHGIQKLPCRADSGGPFPNKSEPSDHLLIAADLELVST